MSITIFSQTLQMTGVLFALAAAVSWGMASILYKIVLEKENVMISVIVRGLFAVPFTFFITLILSGSDAFASLFTPEVLPLLTLSGVLVALGDIIYFGSLKRINVSKAQPIGAIYPLFTAIILLVTNTEDLSMMVLLGTFTIVTGIALISQRDRSQTLSTEDNKTMNEGIIFAILAAVCWAVAIYTLKLLLDKPQVDVYAMATVRFAILTVFTGLVWLSLHLMEKDEIEPKLRKNMSIKNFLILGCGGILSWGIGGVFFFSSIDMIGAGRASPISSINPLISVILGVILLKENLTKKQVIGIVLATIGSILVT